MFLKRIKIIGKRERNFIIKIENLKINLNVG